MTKKIDEKKALFSDFLIKIEQGLCLALEKESRRFPSWNKLLCKFKKFRSRFDSEANALSREQSDKFIREATELVNEMCVAQKILTSSRQEVTQLDYEPPLPCTRRTIDFRSAAADGKVTWWDVKTVHPEGKDVWGKYVDHMRCKLLHGLTLDKNGFGGEFYHKYYASRDKFLKYTLELEEKIANSGKAGKDKFVMVFCGNRWDWELDDLEDFADFYFTGYHRYDDHFAEMEEYYIKEKNISLSRTINRFCYLRRAVAETEPDEWVQDVRGPRFGSRH